MGDTDLLASPTRAAESLAPGVSQRLQTIRQRYDSDGTFYGHIGQTGDANSEHLVQEVEF
jgi:hypothetical protein